MNPVCTRITIVVPVLLAVVLSGAETVAQNNPLLIPGPWNNAAVGLWSDGSNWLSGLQPDRDLSEYATIYNGGTAVIDSAISASPTDIYLGHQDMTDPFNPGPLGPGALIIQDGGGITAMASDQNDGNGQLRNGAGDVGTLTLHDAMGTVSLEGYLQSGTSTLNLEIDGTTFNSVTVSREIQLAGVLQVNGALASANASSSWTIFDGSAGVASVSGQFQQIVDNTGHVFGPGQSFAVSTANNSVTLGIQQQLLLFVNPYTGTAVLSNPVGSGVGVDLTGYQMSVSDGTVDDSQWISFTDDGVPGFVEGSNATQFAETSATGMTTVATGTNKDFGAPLAININQPLGTDLTDSVSFQYSTPGNEIVDAVIVHEGNRQNNLVLVVDPTTGGSVLQNQSNIGLDLTGYVIESASGALLATTWTDLEGQGVTGWDVAAGTANALAELNPENSSMLGVGDTLDLGVLWDKSAEDLTLQFSLGATTVMDGAVFYGDPADIGGGVDGDYDGDGDVDGNDYLIWQRGESPNLGSVGDFDLWQANFGTTGGASAAASAVPEPNGLCLLVVSLLAAGALRRKARLV